MPLSVASWKTRLALAVSAAVAAALAATLAFNRVEDEPVREHAQAPAMASEPPNTVGSTGVLDRVLVRPPGANEAAPGADAPPSDAVVGEARQTETNERPQPEPRPDTAVATAPTNPPPAPRNEPRPRERVTPAPPPREDAAPAPRQDAPRTAEASTDAGQARRLNREGIGLINAGRAGQAIPPLERAASLQPRDAEILGNLGYAYMLVGEHDAARRHLTRALDYAPTRSATWLNLGQTYAELGERERAIDAVVTGYRHSTRKASVRSALLAAATGTQHSPRWREAAGLALARIGDR